MRLSDELEPKLPEIRRWAEDLFSNQELRPYGLHFDENGAVAFDRSNPMNQPQLGGNQWTEEDIQQLIATVRDKVDRFYADLETLLAAFRAYYDLDSLDFTVLAGTLGGQKGQVGGPPTNIHSRIGYAEHYWVAPVDGLINAKDWDGGEDGAAANFERQLLRPFHDAVQQQQGYVTVLAIVAQLYHDYLARMRDALLAVADECIDALGGPARVTAGELTTKVNALSAVSLALGVLSLFPPAAPVAGPTSVWTGAVALEMALTTDSASGPKNLPSLYRDTVWEVLQATREMLTTVDRYLTDADDKVSKALDEALNSTSSLASPGLTIHPPDAADQPANANFNTLTVQSEPGVPLSQDKVVVSVVDVYKAGKVNLLGAAAQYAEAATELAACTTPASLTRFFPRSVPKFHAARTILAGIFENTRQVLERSAEALMAIAMNYQTTDDRSAEALAQMEMYSTPDPNPEPTRVGGV
jgi:hypothetical protein